MPRVILTSPDRQTVLRLDPDPNRSWWTLHHTGDRDRPAWSVAFDAQTPVECIAALTDALASPRSSPARITHPYDYLGQAGWVRARDHDGFTSPDGHCDIEHFVSSSGNSKWYVNTAVSGDPEGQIWQAHLPGDTPPTPRCRLRSRARRPCAPGPRPAAAAHPRAGTHPHPAPADPPPDGHRAGTTHCTPHPTTRRLRHRRRGTSAADSQAAPPSLNSPHRSGTASCPSPPPVPPAPGTTWPSRS
ncbi:DUF317 domain-containing protein [Streptomyces noursei]|uniref:DUF317 domain-containing protein n=1 Tax=Streptomyces noursei TaxID=1971 RepID=UPI0009964127